MGVVDTVCEEHGGQVHVGKMASVKRSQAVLGQVLDPLVSWAIVEVWIVRQIPSVVVTTHGDEQHAYQHVVVVGNSGSGNGP